jgi:hypothetical protein
MMNHQPAVSFIGMMKIAQNTGIVTIRPLLSWRVVRMGFIGM